MDERKRIEELRGQVAEIDQEILHTIERRARVAQELTKLRPGTARFAPVVDAAHLQALERAAPPQVPASLIRPIFTAIDAVCRSSELSPRVIYLGAEGDFGWIAGWDYFGKGAEYVRADSPGAALDEVARSRADFAVVPYESFKEGPLFPTIQAIAGADLKVVGERELAQSLSLVNRTGNLAEVAKVYASPQDHVACVNYLEHHHPRALVLDVRSPQMAWDLAAEDASSAAIVPRGFAGARELMVARENIGDEGEIRLRYGVVSRLPAPRSGHDATALLFSVSDRPGALHDILHHFKERSCNLRRIHSRPIPGEGWEYVFYVEVGGHSTDRALVAALEGVKRETKMLKIIGSFPLERPEPTSPAERL
ncbi:MAG TPA: prephenate dehydratase domain-containing protein [Candidatus Nanopelagicales bacterium]|nr:prephenate dehydratase domain-containing protein [Candidatus Nanopelagicales bacterium]